MSFAFPQRKVCVGKEGETLGSRGASRTPVLLCARVGAGCGPGGLGGCWLERQGLMLDAVVVIPPVPARIWEFLLEKRTLGFTANKLPANQTQLSKGSSSHRFEAEPRNSSAVPPLASLP